MSRGCSPCCEPSGRLLAVLVRLDDSPVFGATLCGTQGKCTPLLDMRLAHLPCPQSCPPFARTTFSAGSVEVGMAVGGKLEKAHHGPKPPFGFGVAPRVEEDEPQHGLPVIQQLGMLDFPGLEAAAQFRLGRQQALGLVFEHVVAEALLLVEHAVEERPAEEAVDP